MNQHEQRVVRFLSRPASYPHPVGAIQRRETHVSHVFLAGGFAYKLKKPVKFPFLDASTLTLRKRFCLLELSLNRRLAPTIYLGIVPITEGLRGLQFGGKGRVVEWVVKMRRLPEERMLDQLVAQHQVSRRDMQDIADQLIRFFRHAARNSSIDRYGKPAQVCALVLGNLQECQQFVGSVFQESDRQFLASAYRQYLTLQQPMLEQRVRERRIIDGHGDLRCENICLSRPVNIFDCVEFQPAFRCGDSANDFSFLLMDLEFRGRQDLADVLAKRYEVKTDDPTFEQVLPFYKCHRSLVRGKVRAFAWLQHPNTPEGRRARSLSRAHFQLAVRYAKAFAPPRLIVVGGAIGSGKSTLAKELAEALGAVWLRSDEIRLTEFAPAYHPVKDGAGRHERKRQEGFAEGLYAPRVSQRVYEQLIQRAEQAIRQGRSVVCDGTFSKMAGREALRSAAKRHHASFYFFECTVPRAVALRRIAKRAAARTDISEARPEHYDQLTAGFEPVRGWPRSMWQRISDNRPPAQTLHAALGILRRAWAA